MRPWSIYIDGLDVARAVAEAVDHKDRKEQWLVYATEFEAAQRILAELLPPPMPPSVPEPVRGRGISLQGVPV